MNKQNKFYLKESELEDNEMTEIWETDDQPEKDFESADKEKTSKEKCLIKITIATGFFLQTQMGFSDSCLEYLLPFIKLLVQLFKSNYLIASIKKLFEIFSSSIFMDRHDKKTDSHMVNAFT